MGKSFYDIEDVKQILGVSDSKGYEYIRIMNQELAKRGYLTVRGKVPVRYFNVIMSAKRYYWLKLKNTYFSRIYGGKINGR